MCNRNLAKGVNMGGVSGTGGGGSNQWGDQATGGGGSQGGDQATGGGGSQWGDQATGGGGSRQDQMVGGSGNRNNNQATGGGGSNMNGNQPVGGGGSNMGGGQAVGGGGSGGWSNAHAQIGSGNQNVRLVTDTENVYGRGSGVSNCWYCMGAVACQNRSSWQRKTCDDRRQDTCYALHHNNNQTTYEMGCTHYTCRLLKGYNDDSTCRKCSDPNCNEGLFLASRRVGGGNQWNLRYASAEYDD